MTMVLSVKTPVPVQLAPPVFGLARIASVLIPVPPSLVTAAPPALVLEKMILARDPAEPAVEAMGSEAAVVDRVRDSCFGRIPFSNVFLACPCQ